MSFANRPGTSEYTPSARKAVISAYEKNYDTGLVVPPALPLTSIVIPVDDGIELTEICLNSIYSVKSLSPFEVILVDDCSSVDYKQLESVYPNLKVIRNETHQGIIKSANKGAAEAGGEFLVFSDNSSEVMAWWLDELTTALYKHPRAGMIGSQLIDLHTERLQECGRRICRNGDIVLLGRGEYPDHHNHSFFQEVDSCSAASFIIRRKLFDEMGGFNEMYASPGFEANELGLLLQKEGYKNYVSPHSRVLHLGKNPSDNSTDEQYEKNRTLFMTRWQQYLQENAVYENSEDLRNFKGDKERILYIDAEFPMADRGSGGMDAIFFMEYMIKRNYQVIFYGEHTPGYHPKYTGILLRMGVQCIYEPFLKIWDYVAHNGHTLSYIFVSRIYQARSFDWLLKPYCSQAGYIFNTVDLHFVRETLEADLRIDDLGRKRAAYTKQCELTVASFADATIVISSKEKALLEDEYALSRIYHIPQVRELFPRAAHTCRQGAVFIGSAHTPNLDGLCYFHNEILPLLPEDFVLTVVGESLRSTIEHNDMYKHLLCCKQFKFVGFVQDLGTVLDCARITVAPLRYGAGTKGKVASSMAYGVPCVSTVFGTEGTGMVHGDNVMIANTPQEFAAYICELLSEPELWQRISDGGRKFIKETYARESAEKMMDQLIEDVRKRRLEKTSDWASKPIIG
ncbi:MAG: glycosyltransferase [Lentisphaerae bacterium]|nr:glycosyltransferase [Lentisphaerota bacterium]